MSKPVKYETVEDIFSGRLRGNQLMISGIHLGPEEARLLWNSPKLKEVNWLDLDDNNLGDEGVKDLAECEYLTNIQYLNLNKNGVGDEGIRFLAQSKNLPKLKRLHLKNNPIKGEGVVVLFDSQKLFDTEAYLSSDIDAFQTNKLLQNPRLKKQFIKAAWLLESFRRGDLKTSDVKIEQPGKHGCECCPAQRPQRNGDQQREQPESKPSERIH